MTSQTTIPPEVEPVLTYEQLRDFDLYSGLHPGYRWFMEQFEGLDNSEQGDFNQFNKTCDQYNFTELCSSVDLGPALGLSVPFSRLTMCLPLLQVFTKLRIVEARDQKLPTQFMDKIDFVDRRL